MAQTLKTVSVSEVGPLTPIDETTFSISAAGVGSDGLTTYVEYGTASAILQVAGTVTKTLLSGDTPFTATFREDASHFEMGTASVGPAYESCIFQADGKGVCVYDISTTGSSAEITATFTGLVVPFYTLDAAGSTSGSSSTSAASSSGAPSSGGASANAADTMWRKWPPLFLLLSFYLLLGV